MSDDQGTPQGETAIVGTTEPLATPQATGTDPAPETSTQPEATPVVEDPATLAKRLAQLEMRNNQLEKQTKEYEQAKEQQRLAELSEVDRLNEELSQLKAKDERAEAQKLREQIISEYPDAATRDAARRLLSKNESAILWGEVDSIEAAKADVFAQLDAIKEVVSVPPANPSVHPNNPAPDNQPVVTREEALAVAAKSRDFSQILRSIPSVQEQVRSMGEDL